MATYAVTIDAVTKTLQDGWTIHEPANGFATLRAAVFSSNGSYIPDLSDEVIITENGTRIFGGIIEQAQTAGALGGPETPITTTFTAQSFAVLSTRRYFNGTIAAGTLKAALTTLVAYIQGVTLDAGQVNGPTLTALTFQVWKINDILDYLSSLTGYVWRIDHNKVLAMFTPGTEAAPFSVTIASKAAISDLTMEPVRDRYANGIIVYGSGVNGSATDSAEQTANGIWELAVQSPDITDQTTADNLAAAILSQSIITAKRVRYRTKQLSIKPSQTQTITIAARNVNNTFLITEVITRAVSPTRVEREIEAIEGTVFQPGWRDTIKSWGAGGNSVVFPGVSSGPASVRYAYFLGGNGSDFVESATPTWVDASPIRVQLNTVARGTTAATINGRLRALTTGVSVTARLYDATAASALSGTSAVVTDTAWTTISFSVTLNAGSHYYVLQLLPGTANEPVGAVCYVE